MSRARSIGVLVAFAVMTGVLAAPAVAGEHQAGFVPPPPGATAEEVCIEGAPGVILGTEDDDVLTGTKGPDIICGLGGDDLIDGDGQDDYLYGGPGADVIEAGTGNDYVDAGPGDDTVNGDSGDDLVLAGEGNDVVAGGNGDDEIDAGPGDDVVDGGNGSDFVTAGPGADTVDLGNGKDTASLGVGDDVADAGMGNDRVFGDEGDDQILLGNGADVGDGGDGFDAIDGGNGKDQCLYAEETTNCEEDETGLPQLVADEVTVVPPGPGEVVAEGGPFAEGVLVVVQSAGGLAPSGVSIVPNREFNSGMDPVRASPVFDITADPPGAVLSAELTIPYDETRTDIFEETDLEIFTYDEELQWWLPVPGTVIDPAANTATATVEHFSLYMVAQPLPGPDFPGDVNSANSWRDYFERAGARCLDPDDPTIGLDVVFVIDTSGSMRSNDPTGLRVDGALGFLAQMRDTDGAGVVGFSSFAVNERFLAPLDTQAERDDATAALERLRRAGGGTSLTAGMTAAINQFQNASEGRVRSIVFLTDGVGSYNTNLTQQAAEEAIAVYTIGLGSGVNASLLQSIADGTGGDYFPLANAGQLEDLYDEIVGNLIDDGTDTDGDGLTDCVETNGMLAPAALWNPGTRQYTTITSAYLLFTDPELADSDFDDLEDGHEAQERRLSDNPELAVAYSFLIAEGRDVYYQLVDGNPVFQDSDQDLLKDGDSIVTGGLAEQPCLTEPFVYDTDQDGANDFVECFNGTDPLDPSFLDFEIPGLNQFVLFQPDRWRDEPAVEWLYTRPGRNTITRLRVSPRDTVTYDDDYNCVSNCDELFAEAALRSNDNGWGFCYGGPFSDCVTDESQVRDMIRRRVDAQDVFDGDGYLSVDYITVAAQFLCYDNFDARCDEGDIKDEIDRDQFERRPPNLAFATGTAVARHITEEKRRGNTPTIDPEKLQRFIEIAVVSYIVYREATAANRRARIEQNTRRCVELLPGVVLEAIGFPNGNHPCLELAVFLPGERDAGGAAVNDAVAIANDPTKAILLYRSRQETRDAGIATAWYNAFDPCKLPRPAGQACDEFPFYATTRSGPPVESDDPFGTRLALVDSGENSAEGTAYSAFTRACRTVNGAAGARLPFLVIPLVGPFAANTDFYCTR